MKCEKCGHEPVEECVEENTVLKPPMFGELEDQLRRRYKHQSADGRYSGGPAAVLLQAANAIRDLRMALASQIEITNAERGRAENAEPKRERL